MPTEKDRAKKLNDLVAKYIDACNRMIKSSGEFERAFTDVLSIGTTLQNGFKYMQSYKPELKEVDMVAYLLDDLLNHELSDIRFNVAAAKKEVEGVQSELNSMKALSSRRALRYNSRRQSPPTVRRRRYYD